MTNSAKTVCICGSMSFIDDMEGLRAILRSAGFAVTTPVRGERKIGLSNIDDDEAMIIKRRYIDGYLDEIRKSDAVLIANYPKNGIEGYVGANALMEAAFGYALGLPVILLFEPGPQRCRLEIRSIMQECLDGDPSQLTI
jgi:hypothetical protein